MADDQVVQSAPDPVTVPLPPKNFAVDESKIFNVTIRGWIAYSLVATVCIMSLIKIKVEEPLYTLVMTAVAFYLGQKTAGKT